MNKKSLFRLASAVAAAAVLLAACSQVGDDPTLDPSMVVIGPTLEVDKSLTVRHSQSVEPRVTDKTAVTPEVDVTDGTAELSYTMVVEDVVAAESDSATIADLSVANTGSAAVTVDILDTLYCGDGNGVADPSGAISILVHQESDVAIAAGDTHVVPGPFGPYDVGACPASGDGITRDVVNRVVVSNADTGAVLVEIDLLPSDRLASSSIAAAYLVDEEQIPSGYAITDATLTLEGADVPFTASMSGDTYRIVTDAPASAGTYHLTKTLTRDAGVACEPDLTVVNTAYTSSDGTADAMVGSAATATIALICTPEEGGEGCTPGFWQNWTGMPPGNQPNAWAATGYHWSDPFTSAGFVDAYDGRTLLEVLERGGGGMNALGRHTVAALLNAAHPDVAYDLGVAEVVSMFNDVVVNDGNVNALKNQFEALNEQGCPLSQAVY